jgi:hypothetical protein
VTVPEPVAELDERFSSPDASATQWGEAVGVLENAELYWVTTVRPDGRPHITPLIAVWIDSAMYFCTGPDERKAKNLLGNAHCAFTTGCNSLKEGLDLVVEGRVERVTDKAELEDLADHYRVKYGPDWDFAAGDEGFLHEAGVALVYRVAPTVVFGFRKGEPFGQTRWRF